MKFIAFLSNKIISWAKNRKPDYIIGGEEDPYLRRHWLIPRNRFFNIYVHEFLHSDYDGALHCHPWINCSLLLEGEYTEHTISAGGVHNRQILKAGGIRMRWSGKFAHRVELHAGPVWTMFITGPVYRTWGFHCTNGWIPWRKFVSERDSGVIGKGCNG